MSAQAADTASQVKKCSHCQRTLQARPNFTFGRDPLTGKLSGECMECEGRRKVHDPAYGYELLMREIGTGTIAQAIRTHWSGQLYAGMLTNAGNRCTYCGSDLHEWGHGHKLDRIDHSKPWLFQNVAPCCQPCIVDRAQLTVPEWRNARLDEMLRIYGRGCIPWENVLRKRCPPKVKIPNLRDYSAGAVLKEVKPEPITPEQARDIAETLAGAPHVLAAFTGDMGKAVAPKPEPPPSAVVPVVPPAPPPIQVQEADHCLIVTLSGQALAELQAKVRARGANPSDDAELEREASQALAGAMCELPAGRTPAGLIALATAYVGAADARYRLGERLAAFGLQPDWPDFVEAMRALVAEGLPSAEAYLSGRIVSEAADLDEEIEELPQGVDLPPPDIRPKAATPRQRGIVADNLPACAIALAELLNESASTSFQASAFAAKLGKETGRGIAPVLIALRGRGWVDKGTEYGEWVIHVEPLAEYMTAMAADQEVAQ